VRHGSSDGAHLSGRTPVALVRTASEPLNAPAYNSQRRPHSVTNETRHSVTHEIRHSVMIPWNYSYSSSMTNCTSQFRNELYQIRGPLPYLRNFNSGGSNLQPSDGVISCRGLYLGDRELAELANYLLARQCPYMSLTNMNHGKVPTV
jgi:hypothetical protein